MRFNKKRKKFRRFPIIPRDNSCEKTTRGENVEEEEEKKHQQQQRS